jgi:hypothetical protein
MAAPSRLPMDSVPTMSPSREDHDGADCDLEVGTVYMSNSNRLKLSQTRSRRGVVSMKMTGPGLLLLLLIAQPMIQRTAAASQGSTAQATEAPAQTAPSPVSPAPAPMKIKPGDRVYIQPGDFGMALTAAILKKKVPVTVLDDSTKADFWIQTVSSSSQEKTGVRIVKILAMGSAAGSGRHFQATVTVKNRDGAMVFAYNSQKENFQSAAQNVAKNLKKHIEKE